MQISTRLVTKVIWAITNLFLNPIAGIVFCFINKIGFVPMLLTVIGAILMGLGATYPTGEVVQ